MNREHLAQIWKWMSITALLFLVGSVISIQGGSEFVGKLFGDVVGKVTDNLPAVGYFASFIGGFLFFVASSALALHAKRHGRAWHDRIPVVWLEGLKTDTWDGKVFQVVMLVMFLAIPATGIVLCIISAESGDICELDTDHFYSGKDTTLLWPPTSVSGAQMRLRGGNVGSQPCKSGIQIFPRVGTPVLVYGIPAAAGGMALFALGLVFIPRRAKQDGPGEEDGFFSMAP